MDAGTLHDAFIDELRDTYDGERQLTKALTKASSNPKLRQAFESHLEETQGQIERLEQVFESLDEKARDTAAQNDHALRQIRTVLKGNIADSLRLTFRRGRRLAGVRRRRNQESKT